MKDLLARTKSIVGSSIYILLTLLILHTPSVSAITSADVQSIKGLTPFFDATSGGNTGTCPSSDDSALTSGNTPSGISDFSKGQLETFAREAITSTWNISDSTVEQWFLGKQNVKNTNKSTSSANDKEIVGVIPRYGITSANIGQITAVVKAAGVSPQFFYIYTVNEGGGLGGFINHFSQSTNHAGAQQGGDFAGGLLDAKRDAEKLLQVTNDTDLNDYHPAWYDVDKPVYYFGPPESVQEAGNNDFKSMPVGTIGRAYIPNTAAATWEYYYPAALDKSVNLKGSYGGPMQLAMKFIKTMGGDPMNGGVAVSSADSADSSCIGPGGVTGTGMAKAISWAEMIANNNGYGYDIGLSQRTTGWTKWQSDPSCTSQCGSFDCSSFVSAALTEAGYFTTNPNFDTSGEPGKLEGVGFTKVNVSSFDTSKDLLPGDILVTPDSHTEIYIGNNQTVGAHSDYDGKLGDSTKTGKEISVVTYENHPWAAAYRTTK